MPRAARPSATTNCAGWASGGATEFLLCIVRFRPRDTRFYHPRSQFILGARGKQGKLRGRRRSTRSTGARTTVLVIVEGTAQLGGKPANGAATAVSAAHLCGVPWPWEYHRPPSIRRAPKSSSSSSSGSRGEKPRSPMFGTAAMGTSSTFSASSAVLSPDGAAVFF